MIQFAAILERDLHISGFWRFGTGSELLDLPELRLAALSRWHARESQVSTSSDMVRTNNIITNFINIINVINYY